MSAIGSTNRLATMHAGPTKMSVPIKVHLIGPGGAWFGSFLGWWPIGLATLDIAPNHKAAPQWAVSRLRALARCQHASDSAEVQHVSDTELSVMNLNELEPFVHALQETIWLGVSVVQLVLIDFICVLL